MKLNVLLSRLTHLLIVGNVLQAAASSQKGSGKEVTCQKNGFICDGCTSSYFCTQLHDGTYELTKVEECPVGSACSEDTGRCVRYDIPECNQEYKFKCHHPGMFPDPFNCSKYHICAEDEPGVFKDHEQDCPEGFAYSYKDLICKVEIAVSGCEVPVKECTDIGEMHRVGDHDSMFSICTRSGGAKVYPELYYCFENLLFLGDRCGNPDLGLNEDGTCRGTGFFYHPKDCTYYRRCSGSGEMPFEGRCYCGNKFDPSIDLNSYCSSPSWCKL